VAAAGRAEAKLEKGQTMRMMEDMHVVEIRDMIRQLLAALEVSGEEMQFFLREDRDAGRVEQR
jgi:hypothetical protein